MTYNVKFIEQPFLAINSKKFCSCTSKFDYVLSLDGDEALSNELINILEAKKILIRWILCK